MKNNFLLFICIFLFSILIQINCKKQATIDDIEEAIKNKKLTLDDLKKANRENKNVPPTVVVFYFEEDHIKDRELYAPYLREFLSTLGITVTQTTFGNKNELITVLLNVGDTFNKDYVTKTFKGIIKDVLIRDFSKDL